MMLFPKFKAFVLQLPLTVDELFLVGTACPTVGLSGSCRAASEWTACFAWDGLTDSSVFTTTRAASSSRGGKTKRERESKNEGGRGAQGADSIG